VPAESIASEVSYTLPVLKPAERTCHGEGGVTVSTYLPGEGQPAIRSVIVASASVGIIAPLIHGLIGLFMVAIPSISYSTFRL
jgi:hypothetical protein